MHPILIKEMATVLVADRLRDATRSRRPFTETSIPSGTVAPEPDAHIARRAEALPARPRRRPGAVSSDCSRAGGAQIADAAADPRHGARGRSPLTSRARRWKT